MEEAFALHLGIGGTGELSLDEQDRLTAEDRAWWYNKLQKVAADRNKKQTPNIPHISGPNIPHH